MTDFQPAMENEALIDQPTRNRLSTLYRSADRHYHGLAHIEALLGLAREYRPALADPDAVEAAIWFHDAIYDSRAGDNEARSAAVARNDLAGRAAAGRIERIAVMIEATATHHVPDLGEPGANRDAALFLDMDLSILGAAPAAFDAYEQAVRREYAWVDEAAWRTGRSAVLRGFLTRPHIFHTPEFRTRFEAAARENLERSVKGLAAGG
jgi:predicted metal-dependent HD superfamily phosphohydrolase